MAGLAGAAARPGAAADAIDGVIPHLVVEPESAAEVAAVLGEAARDHLITVLRGNGTKLAWGRPPAHIDLVVGLRRLNRLLAHAHSDLTATVEAGATVEELNDALARHQQWLPLDGVADGTIGGAIATNDSGPLRHRFGTPRDLLIGIQLATTDGRLIKAGGNVVKNVAGYDLGKLVSGSFGAFAAIVSATFKLLPMPAASKTLSVRFADHKALGDAVTAINTSQLEPIALDVVGRPFAGRQPGREGQANEYQLLVRFATSPFATQAQIDAVRALIPDSIQDVVSGDREMVLWRNHTDRVWKSRGSIVKTSWLPSALTEVLAFIEEVATESGATVELLARAGVGSGTVRIDADAASQVSAIERLRAVPELLRHVTVLRADPVIKVKVDVWGPLGGSGVLAGAIKRALDPAGILNAGRGPI
jgi:glycolate dehydrogenase FAD-binding subunit